MSAPRDIEVQVLPQATLCPNGATLKLARRGTLLDALLDNGIALEHACERVGACATCHVHVREGAALLSPADDDEEDQLDRAWGLDAQSRLSCCVRLKMLQPGQRLVVQLPLHTRNHARES